MILAALLSVLASPSSAGAGSLAPALSPGPATVVWECPDLVPVDGPDGSPAGYAASGCGLSGPSQNIILPEKHLFFPLDSGSDPVVRVTAEGQAPVDQIRVRAFAFPSSGSLFSPVDPSALPDSWGGLERVHRFRGAWLAEIVLHPVISSGDGLVRAGRLVVRVTEGPPAGRAGRPRRPSRAEAELFHLLCGDLESTARRPVASGTSGSPFWGLPWARISIDTAGIYSIACDAVPGAEGALSSSLAMYCGRGRQMGVVPWDSCFVPRPVPMLVEDGGDGTFDPGDRIIFFARGLSWWSPDGSPTPTHFMHAAALHNCYWLTWGGAGGTGMQSIDAGLTGAPAVPQSYLARAHFERDFVWKRGLTDTDWFWDSSLGTGTQWFYHPFDAPGATGQGTLRMFLKSADYGDHHVMVQLNDQVLCDTLWRATGDFTLELPASGFRSSGNMLAYRITHEPGGDAIYFDWFDAFCWSSMHTRGQTEVPLEWHPGTDRFRIDWQDQLSGCRVFAVSGDTAAAELHLSDPRSFEVELPQSWQARELWVVPDGSLMSPVSIEAAQPGRILGTLDGASTLFISASQFTTDVMPLALACPGSQLVDAQEIYDEFNGGVRDPEAIRAFLDNAVATWDPLPLDVVLVGSGHYDPRNNISSAPSFIDALMFPGTETCSDDIYGIVEGSSYPQFAVSRIGARQRTDVQLVAQRTQEYSSGAADGQWQSLVIGAADDERSSKYETDETMHTESMERILEQHVPSVMRPIKHYEIFYPFGEGWKKPEARQALIDLWREGALIFLYLGHGGYDQLADEGLLYIEDLGLLSCGPRLPVAFFGSCSVGDFQHPGRDCMALNATTTPGGGALQAIAATTETYPGTNEFLMASFLDDLFGSSELTTAECLLAAKIGNGYSDNDRRYVLFGDGAVRPAVPPDEVDLSVDRFLTGERSTGGGEAPSQGLVLLEAFESSQADTYYTFRQHLPIPYRTPPARFFSGSCTASPGLDFSLFVPVDADTGSMGRVSAFHLGSGGSAAGSLYPLPLLPGSPSASDTVGPEITLWLDGFRSSPAPSVSGPITVCAELSDSSGIDLLGNPGMQLALYIDGTPQDVSGSFRFDAGSSTTGSMETDIGTLQEGAHSLELRASDCLLNRSSETLGFTVTAGGSLELWQVFAYPCPSSGHGLSLNWMQSADGSADVEIFTVAGRRIAAWRNLPAEAGYNSMWWDCNDADGDPVASGAYVYRLRASSGPASAEVTGVLAIVR